jgi:hypothetical protein
MIDLILIGLLISAFFLNRDILPALVAYSLCMAYQFTLFDHHSAVMNHVMYGLIFIPCIYFATMRLACAMLSYSLFHLVVAVDYFLFPSLNTVISVYYNYLQALLSLSLIYFSGVQRDNVNTSGGYTRFNLPRLGNLWNISTH